MNILVDNIIVNYNDVGNGKVILFLHGWQDNLNTFDNIIDILKNKYRCISIDLPGFGKSSDPDFDWYLIDYTNFINKFIKKLNIEIFAIIGHSFGGRIILKGIGNKIIDTEKIILISSAGISKKTIKNKILYIISKCASFILDLPILNNYKYKIKKSIYKKINSDYADSGKLKKIFINIINEDLQNSAKNIDKPTLLIWGEDDTSTPIDYAYIFNKLIKNSKLITIKNEGHFVHQTKYKDIAIYIDNFLS